jgi:hypothetical protein
MDPRLIKEQVTRGDLCEVLEDELLAVEFPLTPDYTSQELLEAWCTKAGMRCEQCIRMESDGEFRRYLRFSTAAVTNVAAHKRSDDLCWIQMLYSTASGTLDQYGGGGSSITHAEVPH